MAYRSQSKRLLRQSRFALLCAALVSPFIVGCQSNAQQDLVAREMRMQEDQIYALEDYLAEYQQLICKIRAENAALRQQLVDGDEIDTTRPQRPTRNGAPAGTDGPAIEVPPTPRTNGPPPQIELPDVPPLEETTSRDGGLEFELASGGEAASAAGEFPQDAMFATPAAASEPIIPREVIRDVWLHGEVVENSGGAPRLIVEIEPLDSSNQPAKFAGSLSLMLLADGPGDGQESLARWDFAPEEVQLAVDAAAGDDTVRFHLELAADTPTTDVTQLWIRLLPQGGDKVLAFADVDLHEPGFFSSFQQVPLQHAPSEERPIVAAVPGKSPSNDPPAPAELNDAGWSIARPGEPANLAEESANSEAQWRAASEPLPITVARSVPATPKRRANRPAPRTTKPKATAANARRPARWSPDRLGDSSAKTPRTATTSGRPSWSATR